MSAADLTIWPRDLEAAARLAGRDLQVLAVPAPRLSEALSRAWQSWSDTLEEPKVPGDAGRTIAGRWGLVPDAPARVVVAAVDGGAAGRALLRTLEVFQDAATGGTAPAALQARLDDVLRGAPVAELHVRVLLQAAVPERTTEALRHHATRSGYEVYELGEPPPRFAVGAAWPRDTILAARDRTGGHLLLLRGQGSARVVDWVAAASPRASTDALVRFAIERGASPPPAGRVSTIGTDFAGVALLELALSAGDTLRRLETPGTRGEAPLDLLVAASDLAVACAERWRLLSRLAPRATLSWAAGGRPALDVALSPRAADAMRQATGPFPLRAQAWASLPLSTAARWRRASFLSALPEAEALPADPFTMWEEGAWCRAGHPGLRLAAIAAALPALDAGSWAAAFVPAEDTRSGERPWFVGVGILGLSDTRPPTPRVGLATVAASDEMPPITQVLGPDAEVIIAPAGPTAVHGAGETRLVHGRRALPAGRELALIGFGHDAFERLESMVALDPRDTADAPLARITVDTAGLSAATSFADDPEIRAILVQWAQRAVRADLRVDGTPIGLQYVLDLGGDLDPGLPAR
ncbi:hypothetical protein L6V77_13670 [Myxococcota bacterium]|nr:hypothetical protein [Myxococcota bacterium]